MAITKLQAESLNLADDFTFTGTIVGAGGNNRPVFLSRKNGDLTGIANATWTKITGWLEISDPDSTFDPSTARFTPGVVGKYFVSLNQFVGAQANTNQALAIYKNGSKVEETYVNTGGDNNLPFNTQAIVTVSSISDYIEAYVFLSGTGVARTVYSSGVNMQFFGYKIIE